jgi:hypothetical protein
MIGSAFAQCWQFYSDGEVVPLNRLIQKKNGMSMHRLCDGRWIPGADVPGGCGRDFALQRVSGTSPAEGIAAVAEGIGEVG